MGIDTNISTQTYIPPIGAGTTGGTTGTTGVTGTTATGTELDTQAILAGLNGLPGGQGASQVDGLPIPVGSSSMDGVLGSLDNDNVSADMYSFMALFQKMAQSMRDTARIDRGVQLQANVTAMQNAAEQMKETAALRFAAGVAQGAMQIAGGMMQIGMSSASMGNTLKGANLDAKGNNTLANPGASLGAKTTANSNIELGKGFTGQGAAQMAYGQALSGTAQGVGGIISSGLNYAADLSDAEKAKFDIAAKVADTGMQHANDMMQQMMDVIRDVRDKLQSIQQAAVETNRGIARNI